MTRHTILIVDDDEHVCGALSRLFGRDGHRVETVQGGNDALQRMRDLTPEVIIIDYGLPDLDGLELAARLRVLYPHSVRVLLTAHTDFSIAQDAINRGGVYRYLLKPWDDTQLRIDVALAISEAERLRTAA